MSWLHLEEFREVAENILLFDYSISLLAKGPGRTCELVLLQKIRLFQIHIVMGQNYCVKTDARPAPEAPFFSSPPTLRKWTNRWLLVLHNWTPTGQGTPTKA